jgi:predicted transposase YbfD/YdcC
MLAFVYQNPSEASMQTQRAKPLLQVFAKVADFRKSRGKRHPLIAILALSCAAALCGASSLTAISQWGRHHRQAVLARLGFTHCPGPSVATLHRVFKGLDVASLEQALSEWWQTWLPDLGPLAIDGKTLRGSGSEDHAPLQLLAAFATQVRVVLAERAITNYDEIEAALALLEGLDLAGWIVTGDAKFTQKRLVAQVIAKHGDYVLTAKANQPTLCADIATLFDDPQVVAETITTTRRIDTHGSRIEVRELQASSALTAEYTGWAGLQQVFRIVRVRINKRTGQRERHVVYGITSLAPAQADARRLAQLVRGHWGIENRLHWVRDVNLGEDASRIRTGHAPQVMAVFRNVAISLLGLLGYDSPLEGMRHFAYNSAEAVKLVIARPNLAA